MKTFFGTLAFIAAFVALGTIGALEYERISFAHATIQGGISIFSLVIFMGLAGGFQESKPSRRW